MSIDCKWNWHNSGHQVWYDDTTFETLENTYPLQFYDDFLGSAGGSVFGATQEWQILDVGANATATVVAVNNSNGQFLLHIHVDNEAEDVVLYQPSNRTFDVGNGLIFEAKIDMAVAVEAGVRGVAGMSGPHNLDKDLTVNSAWFSWAGSQVILCETDDATNNNDAVLTGVTAVAGIPNIYRIDFTTLADVKFFIDGVRVASGTTFDMSNLTVGGTRIMQPYFSLDKAAGAVVGDMNIDYVKILSNRS